ncbi:transaminase [Cellulomonas endophytica]|uniref:transaminase n=1 Tax=Cellulomonas endophytica TaxID=2494735 RepID=UPI001011448D|nr:transaminase [Cellulomonas endophytica]
MSAGTSLPAGPGAHPGPPRRGPVAAVDRDRLAALTREGTEAYVAAHPRCADAHRAAREHLTYGVPMSWMAKWPGPFPLHVAEASGARFRCLDGTEHVDLCLGDTGAMCGHAPARTVAAVVAQAGRGMTAMLPTPDAAVVAAELTARFGAGPSRVARWQLTLSATDANRHVLRYARHLTGRGRVVVMDGCYHGSVDEAFATLDASGAVVARAGNIGAPVPLDRTTLVVPFNDADALGAALATGDVAAVLMEPALTNIGIVLPEPGYLDAVRRLTRAAGAWFVVDETHTLCAGPGGCTAAWGLDPDVVVVGKTIGGGVPVAAFGTTPEIAVEIERRVELEQIDVGGVGGTLAGNALSTAAARATLQEVLTPDAFTGMVAQATRWTDGVQGVLDAVGLPWHVTQLGARAEYAFAPQAPRDGAAAGAADDFPLQQYLHLQALVRGVLLTPFHNMALMCPATSDADVDRHTEAFAEAAAALTA